MEGQVAASANPFRWLRAVAIAATILFFCYWLYGTWKNAVDPQGADFVSFWAAGRLTLQGHPALAYDIVAHRAIERTVGPMIDLMPFPYPPPFLLFVAPFALLPFWLSFCMWIAATAAAYFAAFRRVAPWPYTFAHPANLTNAVVGQNGMLTSALFVGGFTLLDRSPLVAGALLGLLVIKPQLALLVPIVLLAERQWRAIAGAALSTIGTLGLAALILGPATYEAFFGIIAHQAELANGAIPWPKIASIFGALRTIGVPALPALVFHGAAAVIAAVLTWIAWSRKMSTRIPIVASASLLVSPYLFNHDSLLMMIPIGWLIVHQRHPAVVALLWGLSLLAVIAVGPNPTPLAAIIALAVMWREGSPEDVNRVSREVGAAT